MVLIILGYYKSEPLILIVQFNCDSIGYKTVVKFVDSVWSILVNFKSNYTHCKSVCFRSVC